MSDNQPHNQSGDALKSAATDLLAAITKLVNSGASALESMAGEMLKGSGNVIDKQFDLAGFTTVDIGSAFVGEVRQGNTWKVVVTSDDNVMERVSVTVVEKTLRVRLEGFRVSPTRLRVAVILPALEALSVGGASQVSFGGFTPAPAFAALLTGASSLSGEVSADAITVNVTGASKAKLRGAGSSLLLNASGASHVDLAELTVATLEAKLSGASHATARVSQTVDVTASGASHFGYGGEGKLVNSHTSGGSHISQS